MNVFLHALFLLSAAVLVFACFCRFVHTDKTNTVRPIRWVFAILSVVACVCLFAPLLGHYQPDGIATALVTVLALTQVVTSHYWRAGVPQPFRKVP